MESAEVDYRGQLLEALDEHLAGSGLTRVQVVSGRRTAYPNGPADLFLMHGYREVAELDRVLLKDKEEKVRKSASVSLKSFGGAYSAPAVVPYLNAADPVTRQSAAELLGKLKDKQAVDPLIKIMKADSEWEVRAAAATALGDIGDRKALFDLIKMNQDDKEEVQNAANEALKKLKKTQS